MISTLWQRAEGMTAVTVVLFYLAWINLLVAIFSMLPVFPLDGGRVLRAGLWHLRRNLASATRTAASVGRFFALVLVALGVLQRFAGRFGGLWLVLIGWFIMQAGAAGARPASLREALGGLRGRDVMVAMVSAGTGRLLVQERRRVVGLVTGHASRPDPGVARSVNIRALSSPPPHQSVAAPRVCGVTVPLGAPAPPRRWLMTRG